MVAKLLASTILIAALTQGVAFAQDTSTKSDSSTTQMGGNTQSLPQELTQKLENKGFTDVKVVPGSFLVSAKDKDGDPVTMIIGPHSMTIFTAMSAEGTSTTGSGSDSDSSSSMSK